MGRSVSVWEVKHCHNMAVFFHDSAVGFEGRKRKKDRKDLCASAAGFTKSTMGSWRRETTFTFPITSQGPQKQKKKNAGKNVSGRKKASHRIYSLSASLQDWSTQPLRSLPGVQIRSSSQAKPPTLLVRDMFVQRSTMSSIALSGT